VIAFNGGGDGEERVGEHREGVPTVPEASDLMLVQADQALRRLERLLDAPALSRDAHERRQRYPARL
jgi:hypothetical protein